MNRAIARELSAEALRLRQPLSWFEQLYSRAAGDHRIIPWADMIPNPNLASWLKKEDVDGAGKRALVVGCGLGDDAEALASLGFQVTAFDISPTCIAWCSRRFTGSAVTYLVADLFHPPSEWRRSFAFVLEAYTLQVLPEELRQRAMVKVAECVAPRGTLLVIARGRAADDESGEMPWPVGREELAAFVAAGLSEIKFEEYMDNEDPPVRRFRVEYRRPQDVQDAG